MENNGQIDRNSIVEAALRKLATAEHYIGASLVSMPSLYPSGSSVVLQISGGGRGFQISDRGGAYTEAEAMGGLRGFKIEAEKIIAEAAIKFDGREFSVADISADALFSVMQAVSHYSQLAANVTALKVADRLKEEASNRLYEKLVGIFSAKRVAKDVPVLGASNHQWQFDAMVSNGDKKVVFDAVSSHQGSVVWAATKFGDLSRLQTDYGRVAVIDSRKAMGDMLGVISPNVSAIIEMNASDNSFRGLEAA